MPVLGSPLASAQEITLVLPKGAMTQRELLIEAQRLHPELISRAFAHCGDLDEAQEILGEIYLDIEQGKLRFEHKGASPKTFLCAVIANKARNFFRKVARRAKNYLAELFESPPDPGALFSEAQEHLWLRKSLRTLPPRMQEVLRLRYLEGLSVKECQEVMGLSSPGTISEQEKRGIERLRELAKKEGIR